MNFFKSLVSRFRRRDLVDDGYESDGVGHGSLGKYLASRFQRRGGVVDDYEDEQLERRSLGNVVLSVLLFPLRVLFLPFQALGVFHDTGIELDEHDENISVKRNLGRYAKAIVLFPFRLLQLPFKLFGSLLIAQRRDILFVLPALAMIGFFVFVFVQVFVNGNRIERRYQKGAQNALENLDFELAKTYYKRILADNKPTRGQQYEWAMILANTGEPDRAEQMFLELAPDNELGYAPAHRLMALSHAQQLGNTRDPEALKKLRWHLQNSRDSSPEIQQAWAKYYMAVEQYDEAIAALDKAAEANPNYYQLIAAIYKEQGKVAESRLSLEKAANELSKLLKKDELNHNVRISLANVFAKMKRYDEAEAILMQGVRIQPDALIRRAVSDFYVMRHDLAKEEKNDAAVQMKYLVAALNFDRDYPLVYGRMTSMFMEANQTPEAANEIRTTFQKIVASDNPTPLAHFALSNVLWQEDKRMQAQFHLEQAYNMDNSIVIVLNNLAWMLAHSEDPDLDRALELSKTAVKQVPGDYRFRDTLGTIYLKMGLYREAVVELEKSLPGVTDKKSVHQKLAIAYQKLEMPDMAQLHADQSK